MTTYSMLDIVWWLSLFHPLFLSPNYQNVIMSFIFKTGRDAKFLISQHFPDTTESAQSTLSTVYTAFLSFF